MSLWYVWERLGGRPTGGASGGSDVPQLSQWRLGCPTIEPVEVRTSHIWTSGGSDIPYLNLGRFGRPVIQPTGGLRRLTAEPSRGSYYEVRGFKIYTWVRVLGSNWASRAEDQVYLAMYFQLDDCLMICIYCVPTVSNLFFTNESFPTVVEKWPFLVLSFFLSSPFSDLFMTIRWRSDSVRTLFLHGWRWELVHDVLAGVYVVILVLKS